MLVNIENKKKIEKPDFSKLLEKSNQLTSQTENQEFLIQRNLEQIDEITKKLTSKVSKVSTDITKNKAQYLLSGTGFDTEKLSRNLQSINLTTTFEPIEPICETDIDSFLKHEHDLIILTAIEESKKESTNRFQSSFMSSMEEEWNNAKQQLLQIDFKGFKIQKYKEPILDYSQQLIESSSKTMNYLLPPELEEPYLLNQPGIKKTTMDNKMIKYAQVIRKLNEYRFIKKKPFGILSSFQQATILIDERTEKKEEINDCWEILKFMLQEKDVVEGEFKSSYLTEGIYLKKSENLTLKFIQGARNFLEEQYLRFIKNQCKKNPQVSKSGGKPSMKTLINSFLNLKYNSLWPINFEILNEYPIWAQIYYCIRCGDLNNAINIAFEADSKLENLQPYLKQYHENGKLEERLQNQLFQEYKSFISRESTTDPFKILVYNILGKFEVNKSFPNIITTTQDFIWLQLIMIQEKEEINTKTNFPNYHTLNKLQNLIREYGSSYFSKNGKNPLQYFQILLLTQQFSLAIEYLQNLSQYEIEAVHFAIGLYYYGIIDGISPLNTETNFNFVQLLRRYVSLFIQTDPLDSLHYFSLIREPEKEQCIKDLILESREFELLLGNENKPGKIEELLGKNISRNIIKLAAEASEYNGKYEDAIILFDFIENFDQVLQILNTQLSRLLNTKNMEHERLVNLSNIFLSRHLEEEINSKLKNSSLLNTFYSLLHLIDFFNFYNSGNLNEALEVIQSLSIIPFTQDTIEQKLETFKLLDQSIKNNFGEILLCTMDILYKLYGEFKSHSYGGREQKMNELKSQARCLVMFAGMLQYRLPGDTTAKLIRMEVFMS